MSERKHGCKCRGIENRPSSQTRKNNVAKCVPSLESNRLALQDLDLNRLAQPTSSKLKSTSTNTITVSTSCRCVQRRQNNPKTVLTACGCAQRRKKCCVQRTQTNNPPKTQTNCVHESEPTSSTKLRGKTAATQSTSSLNKPKCLTCLNKKSTSTVTSSGTDKGTSARSKQSSTSSTNKGTSSTSSKTGSSLKITGPIQYLTAIPLSQASDKIKESIASSSHRIYCIKAVPSKKITSAVDEAGASNKMCAPTKKVSLKHSKIPTHAPKKPNKELFCSNMEKTGNNNLAKHSMKKDCPEIQKSTGASLNDYGTNKFVSMASSSTAGSATQSLPRINVNAANEYQFPTITNDPQRDMSKSNKSVDEDYFSMEDNQSSDSALIHLKTKMNLESSEQDSGISNQHFLPNFESTRRVMPSELSPSLINNEMIVAEPKNVFMSTGTSASSSLFGKYGEEVSKVTESNIQKEKSFSFLMNSEIFLTDLQKHKILAEDEAAVFKTRKPITIYNDPKIILDRNEQYMREHLFTRGKLDDMDSELKRIFAEYKEMLKVIMNLDSVIKRPAEKKKLIKKLRRRGSNDVLRNDKIKSYIDDLYTLEYLDDIITYEFTQETKYLLTKSTIESNKDGSLRIVVVDWLIKLLDHLEINQSVYLAAIRIFDKIKLHFKKMEYQLVIITSLWIAFKYNNNSDVITVHKLFSLCKGKFSTNQIKEMELTMLKLLDFDLNISNPLDFLYFYLKKENLENDKKIECASNFIIEFSTLFPQYPSILPSLVADAALVLAKSFLNCDVRRDSHFQYNNPIQVNFYANLFLQQLKWLMQPECPYKEIFDRYSGKGCCNISQIFLARSLEVANIDSF
ncbi:unnamed protein product [Brassicogethes aeneus]|uniref:Cyclin-like domain-containing protein n=1 Tax=Brassicogethes aeneus TaxID=1431903 RepID=A0A9P0FF82_BRAAE|nr:unnamed protein product [Brassicogethes aeneus]